MSLGKQVVETIFMAFAGTMGAALGEFTLNEIHVRLVEEPKVCDCGECFTCYIKEIQTSSS